MVAESFSSSPHDVTATDKAAINAIKNSFLKLIFSFQKLNYNHANMGILI
jgi:hypothetical protein